MSTIHSTTASPLDVGDLDALLARAAVAFNDKDIDAFLAIMQPDIVFDHVASPVPLAGQKAIRTFYAQGIWPAFSDMRLELIQGPFLHPTEPQFMVAWRFSGTHTGRLDPPGLDPTGRKVDVVLHERGHMRDGQLSKLAIVFDVATLLRQLGVLPQPGTGPERMMMTTQNLKTRTARLFGRS